MSRKLVIGALNAMAVTFSTAALAEGTAAEAKVMLEKAVSASKRTKRKRWICSTREKADS
jgi:hypothetical protein